MKDANRKPTTHITLFASLLHQARSEEQIQRHLQVLEQQSDQLNALVQDMVRAAATLAPGDPRDTSQSPRFPGD